MSIRYSLTRLLRAGASALFWTICSVGWPGVSEAAVDSLPYVDLRTYGVKANDPASNTSNTSAVKQALSDFASTGAELHFPSGTIFLDQDTVASPSSFKNSITVLGHDLVLSGEGMFATTLVAQGAGSTIPSQGWCLIEVQTARSVSKSRTWPSSREPLQTRRTRTTATSCRSATQTRLHRHKISTSMTCSLVQPLAMASASLAILRRA